MKRTLCVTLLMLASIAATGYLSGLFGDGAGVAAAPPLSLEGMLDEKLPEAPKKTIKMKADNFSCYVCHGNYKEEPLVVAHGSKEDIGCVKCHGESFDHRNDEDNIIPPEVMYPSEKINKCCQECHKEHDVPAHEVIACWQKRCPEKTDPTKLVCTDCHFQHRLKRRVVVWNKRTGEVVKQVDTK